MPELPYGATITLDPIDAYSHLKEPFRSKWIQCITCGQVPTETVYRVHIPSQTQGDKKSHALGTVCCSEDCAQKWLAKVKLRFYTIEGMEGSALLPTQENNRCWIHCFCKEGYYPKYTERCGKWLIWLSPQHIDRYWTKIKQAVEEGRLGDQAKVSSAGFLNKRGMHVICVYTYDYEDKDDVMRVRQMLRELGIKLPIPYKADEDTLQGRYGKDFTPIYRE